VSVDFEPVEQVLLGKAPVDPGPADIGHTALAPAVHALAFILDDPDGYFDYLVRRGVLPYAKDADKRAGLITDLKLAFNAILAIEKVAKQVQQARAQQS
jgi:hypothetical protein